MTFRQDINALRAIAVVSVLLYHFGVPGFAGGFVGVDVFFVISGYLMTGIILGGLAEGHFSLLRFYLARARRIMPALAVLVTALLALGWFFLPPSDYAGLGLHGASSSLFFSNFVYKGEDGYFDVPSRTKWLLHTWSLSVEWQFYLIYPLLLVFFRRHGRTIAALGALSLLVSICTSASIPSFAFYLLPTRLWEMALGGLIVALPKATTRAGRWPGYALIAAAIFCLSHDDTWPGYLALLPTLGTALVIWSNGSAKLEQMRPVQAIGTWSYSLYLWHWPFVVALGYAGLSQDPAAIASAMTLCLIAAIASYTFVEAPLRERKIGWLPLGLMTLLPAALGLALWLAHGVPARVSPAALAFDQAAQEHSSNADRCAFDKKTHRLGAKCKPAEAAFAVWGDSHAGAVYSAVKAASGGRRGVLVTYSSCPTIFGAYVVTKRDKTICPGFNDAALAALKTLPPHAPIMIVNRYGYYLSGRDTSTDRRMMLGFDVPQAGKDGTALFSDTLTQSLCRIKHETGRSVYALKPVPEMGIDIPRTLARRVMILPAQPLPALAHPLAEYEVRQKVVLETLARAHAECGIGVIDTPAALCADGTCQSHDGAEVFYFDDNHLSEAGNKKLVPLLKAIFKK